MNIVIEYINNFAETLKDAEFQEFVSEEYGIENMDDYRALLELEITEIAYDNYQELQTPLLTHEQLAMACTKAAAHYHLAALQDQGMIQSHYDENVNDIVYSLTDAAINRDATLSLATYQNTNWN